MTPSSYASFHAAAELGDPPDHTDLLREQRAASPRLSCCGRYAKHSTIENQARTGNDGYYDEYLTAECPRHGSVPLMEAV